MFENKGYTNSSKLLTPVCNQTVPESSDDVCAVCAGAYCIRVNFGESFIWRLYRRRLLADIIIGGTLLPFFFLWLVCSVQSSSLHDLVNTPFPSSLRTFKEPSRSQNSWK